MKHTILLMLGVFPWIQHSEWQNTPSQAGVFQQDKLMNVKELQVCESDSLFKFHVRGCGCSGCAGSGGGRGTWG